MSKLWWALPLVIMWAPAHAQENWKGVETRPVNGSTPILNGNELIEARCERTTGSPYNCVPGQEAPFQVPIDNFARATSVDVLRESLRANSVAANLAATELNEKIVSVGAQVDALRGRQTADVATLAASVNDLRVATNQSIGGLASQVGLVGARVDALQATQGADVAALTASISTLRGTTNQAVTGLSDQVASVRTRLDALEAGQDDATSAINTSLLGIRDEARRMAALGAVLDIRPPAPGTANRLGITTVTVQGKIALGASYSRQEGRFDVGLAVSTAGRAQAGKASAGLSW